MGYVLERVNSKEKRILDEYKPYYFGRDKNSTIVCVSPIISRNHCIFHVEKNGITVLDLLSSNGVYINGEKITPRVAVHININDIIGLGSCALDNFSPADIVYKLKLWDGTRHQELNCFPENKRKIKADDDEVPRKIKKSDCCEIAEIIDITDESVAKKIVDNLPGPSGSSDEMKNETLKSSRKKKKQKSSSQLISHTTHSSMSNVSNGNKNSNKINAPEENIQNKNPKESNEIDMTIEDEDGSKKQSKSHLPVLNWIKYEDDIPEDVEEFNIVEEKPYASPLKIKMPKLQTKSRYSDVDGVVHLSDEEDDVFPYSQLFDDNVNDNKETTDVNSVKNEIKTEKEEEEDEEVEIDDVKDFFHSQDKDPPCTTLSDDDDDDDNPWLRRLLGSQSPRSSIIPEPRNNNDLSTNENNIEEEDVQLDTEIVNNIKEIHSTDLNKTEVRTEKDSKPKTRDKKKEENEKQRESLIKIDKKNNSKEMEKIENESRKQNMEFDQRKIIRELETTSTNFESPKQTVVDEVLDGTNTRLYKQSSTDNCNKQQTIDRLIAQSIKKPHRRIPQIEPPFMPRGERHGVSCAVTQLEKSTLNTSDSEKRHSNDFQETHDNAVDVISKFKKMSAKEKKDLAIQQKIEEARYLKEQKIRRLKHKFADVLPQRNKRALSMTRKEKDEIKQDRKERLKKIANEKKKPDDNNSPLKRTNKPKAKISTKNRGDFLISDQLNTSNLSEDTDRMSPTEDTGIKIKSTKVNTVNIPNKSKDSLKTKKTFDECIKKTEKSVKTTIEKTKKKESNKEKNESVKIKESEVREVCIKLKDCLIDNVKRKTVHELPTEKTVIEQSIKKVSFNEEITKVHTFIIPEGNNLNKFVRTDLLLKERPLKKILNPHVNDAPHPKLEEFLLRLFHWNPIWLEEQQVLKIDPPVVDQNSLFPVLTIYKSYDDYYKIMSPLLVLEMWKGISKDFLNNESRRNRGTTLHASIVNNSITRTPVPLTNLEVTTFMVEALVTKSDMDHQRHPIYGDLVVFELATMHNNIISFQRIFAYVTSVTQSVLTPFTRFNPDLAKHVTNPHTLMTYTMITRPMRFNIQTNHVQRLKTVSYLRSSLRMVQAIQYLPVSPLHKFILQPNIEDYKLPEVSNHETYKLITNDKLNPKQLEAVLRITNTVIQRVPKIAMIQGPPGTGKSKVIVNIITEILYGGNRYQNKKHPRILVCAPSNAAIDEIVLRLLAIRGNFQPKDQRFRMVRLGMTNSMNPAVKSISVTELAKRDVEKTTMEYFATDKSSLESIELEKSYLLGRINAMKSELEAPSVDRTYKQHLERKYDNIKAKYDFLNNRNSNKKIDRKLLSRFQKSAENAILSGADIITCTLSSCYTNQMESIFGGNTERISVCIVDEATQSTEAETLIPLMLGVTSLVLVGDPNQLPATVISQQAKKLGLDQSLFARLQGSFDGNPDDPVIMLNTQYRMSYPISYWPNRYFYANRLKNSAQIHSLPFHFYKILNLASMQNSDRLSNTNEAAFVANIIFTMMTYSNLDKVDGALKIGIITPYNNQRTLINSKLKERLVNVPDNIRRRVITDVNTVDSFQGQERDVIIMSCVRSSGIGFLNDRQRLCVALTRAKHSLIICGNFKTFEKDRMWNALLTDARKRGVYFNVNYKCGPEELKKHIVK